MYLMFKASRIIYVVRGGGGGVVKDYLNRNEKHQILGSNFVREEKLKSVLS